MSYGCGHLERRPVTLSAAKGRSREVFSPNVCYRYKKEEDTMLTIVILLIALAVFDIAALLWGVNSIDRMDSPEWERRGHWSAFH